MVSSWAESRPGARPAQQRVDLVGVELAAPAAGGRPAAQQAPAHVGVQRLALHAEAGGGLGGGREAGRSLMRGIIVDS